MLLSAGAALGLVIVSVKDLPEFNEANLIPATSTQVFDRDDHLVNQIGLENRVQVSINDLPDHVKYAFLAAEDHYFYEHHGFRIQAIARAALNDALHFLGVNRNFQGGSTITQQLVKLSFLSPERTLKRKIQEVILSFQLERRYSKDEILEMYLNRIYLGEGAYGVQAAAQTYFGKDAGDLTVGEAALLAGLTKSPNYNSPYQNPEVALSARNQVLSGMREYNYIDEQTYQQGLSEKINLNHDGQSATKQYRYPYFMDYITEQLVDKFGEEAVFKGGLKVYTTLDPDIQSFAEKAMANPANFPSSQKNKEGLLQPQGALVIIDPTNGEIRALVGGREHTHMRALNRATMSPRQPGSAIKPVLVYGPAVDLLGMGPATVIDDAPVKYPRYQNYTPHNYDGTYRGLITMRTAITWSVNIPAVKLFTDYLHMNDALKFASKMDLNFKLTGPAMALGSQEVTPLQLAAAYSAFANHGVYNTPVAIRRVEDSTGKILFENEQAPRRVMKETTAYLITDMLRSVVTSGTGTRASIPNWPVAGKTGTTDDLKDIWFAGYTPELVGVVWIGYDTPAKMPYSYGGIYPARIWREVMQQAHRDMKPRSFAKPPGIVTATVDSKSGLLPGPNTPPEHMVTDIFAAGTVPSETDNVHVLTEVCATTGKLPNQYCPDRITRVMLKLPYTVPSYVADYNLRVPTEVCDVHGPETITEPEPGLDNTDSSPPENPDVPVESDFNTGNYRPINNT